MSIQRINKVLTETVERLSEAVDRTEASELKLFIDNDGQLYRGMTTNIYKNLVNKKAAGRYNSQLATKAFLHLADEGAKRYTKEFGSRGDRWHEMFNKPTRMHVAEQLRDDFEEEMKLGNYDYLLMKKYQKTGKRR